MKGLILGAIVLGGLAVVASLAKGSPADGLPRGKGLFVRSLEGIVVRGTAMLRPTQGLTSMKTATKIIIGLVVFSGIVFVARNAFGAPEPPPGPKPAEGGEGVRYGIRYEGCRHFELVDQEAVVSFFKANALRFAGLLAKGKDGILADTAGAAVEVLSVMFPDCPWPPAEGTTFGPERLSWSQALERAATQLASYEGGELEIHPIDLLTLIVSPRST
jgi:hypothetical protein